MKIYKRIQNPAFSDWNTLRVDEIGEAEIIGEVYYASPAGSGARHVIVTMDGQTRDAYWGTPHDGATSTSEHGVLFVHPDFLSVPIVPAQKALSTRKRIRISRGSKIPGGATESWVEAL
jgi:hypothetical protein